MEKYEAAKSLQSIDLIHLASLGVIELSGNAAGETKMNLNPASTPAKEKKPTQKRAPSQKQAKPAEPAAELKREREEEKPAPMPTTPPRAIPEATLATLSPAQKAILEAIPDDGTLSTDAIFALEHPHADLMAALTMLEIMGLVQKLPGSLYKKA